MWHLGRHLPQVQKKYLNTAFHGEIPERVLAKISSLAQDRIELTIDVIRETTLANPSATFFVGFLKECPEIKLTLFNPVTHSKSFTNNAHGHSLVANLQSINSSQIKKFLKAHLHKIGVKENMLKSK